MTRIPRGRGASAPLLFFIIFSLVLSTFPSFDHGPIAPAGADGPGSRQGAGLWSSTKIWADFKPLYVSAIGDVWPGHPGNEIIVGGESNWTAMIYGHEDSWVAQRLFEEAWYVTNVVIGDVDPAEPGLEIVNVGWHGNVSMVYWEDATSTWKHKELVNGNNAHLTWTYGIAIGNMDPRYPGNEVAATDDSGQLIMIHKNGTGWAYELIWQDVGPDIIDPYLDTVILADVDSSHPGDEMLLTGGSKYVTEIYYNNTNKNWTVKKLWRDRASPIQLAVADIINTTPGNEIALVGLSKNLTVLSWNGTGWQAEKVYQEDDVIYDVEIGEVQPGKGIQIVMGSWSSKVTAHRKAPSGQGWESALVYDDDDFVFGVTIGDCDDLHAGNEILVVDRSGVIRKVQYETPDFVLYPPSPVSSVVPGSSVGFDIMVYSRAGFNGDVALTVKDLPGDWTASFSPSKVVPTGRALLTLTVPLEAADGSVVLTVQGVSGGRSHTVNITVVVLLPGEKEFGLSVMPGTQSVVADYSVKFTVAVSSINGFSEDVALTVSGLPDGVSAFFTPATIKAPGSSVLEVRTVSSTPLGTHFLTVKGSAVTKQHSATVVLTVKDASSPDFSLSLGPNSLVMVGSHSVNISVNLVSLYGFSQNVSLSVPGVPHGMTAKFTPYSLVPSGTSTMNLTVEASVPAGTYYIIVEGASGGTVHSAALRVDLNTAGDPDFTVKVWPAAANITASFSAYFNVSILPVNDFAANVAVTVTGLPIGAVAVLTPATIGPYQYSKLEVKTLITTPAGSYDLVVKCKGSGLERTAGVRLTVIEALPHVAFVKVDGIPSTAELGQVIKIKAWIENTGIIDAKNCKLYLIVDGFQEAAATFTVRVGGQEQVNLTWTAKEGKHNLTLFVITSPATPDIDHFTKNINVTNPTKVMGNTLLWIIIAVVGIVLVAVAAGFVLGKKGQEPEAEIEEDDIEELRPAKKNSPRPRRKQGH